MQLQEISSSLAKTLRKRVEKESSFRLSPPGCLHGRDASWLEVEIVRETTTVTQHVAWVDLIPETETLTAFALNLVDVAQVNTNQTAYEEIIRDGYRTNPLTSHIHQP